MPNKGFRERLIQAGTDSHLQIDIIEPIHPNKSRNWGGLREGAGKATQAKAEKHYDPIIPCLERYVEQGITLQEMADRLNVMGHRTQTGKLFNRVHVHKVIKRKNLRK